MWLSYSVCDCSGTADGQNHDRSASCLSSALRPLSEAELPSARPCTHTQTHSWKRNSLPYAERQGWPFSLALWSKFKSVSPSSQDIAVILGYNWWLSRGRWRQGSLPTLWCARYDDESQRGRQFMRCGLWPYLPKLPRLLGPVASWTN
jgi:hypothetical protein